MAFERLEYGTVFAIDREDRNTPFLGFSHNKRSGHNDSFLVGQGDILSSLDGLIRGHQTCCAGHGRNNGIHAFQGCNAYESLYAEEDLGSVACGQAVLHLYRKGFLRDGNGCGSEGLYLAQEKVFVLAGRKGYDFKVFRVGSCHLEGPDPN